MAEVDTHHVTLTGLSGAGVSRLRNGHPCRCSLGAKGEGVGAHLSEDNIKKLLKAGKKGAKATIKLTQREMAKNRSEGSGIMAGGKVSLKKVGKVAGKVAKSKIGRKAIDAGVGAASSALLGPEAAPVAAALTDAALGGKIKVGKIAKKVAKNPTVQKLAKKGAQKAIDAGMDYATGGKIKVGKIAKKVAKNPTVQRVAKKGAKKAIDAGMDYAMGGEGMYAGSGIFAGSGLYARGGSFVAGGAIGPQPRVTNVGAGGNLLGPVNPALQSQARASNWFFHTQFPPALAEEITGSGLYAGRGLYA